ncbi:MAG: hypothetical protein JW809_14840 [Pirellulales bacterium]|nr:hypothetical protein [Pirellulales bacterium]
MTLDPDRVAHVERLLAEQRHSQRAIAATAGVSRGTVAAIAAGRRRVLPPREPDPGPAWRDGPVKRCPACGARVHLPCEACRLKAESGKRRAETRTPERIDPLQLELRLEHLVRYPEARRRMRRRIQEHGEPARPQTPVPSP